MLRTRITGPRSFEIQIVIAIFGYIRVSQMGEKIIGMLRTRITGPRSFEIQIVIAIFRCYLELEGDGE